MPADPANGHQAELPYIDFAYNHRESAATAKELVCRIQPKWRAHPEQIQIIQFKEGITNTARPILKPGHDEIDGESILMRSYGNNTDILIDRDREARSHAVPSPNIWTVMLKWVHALPQSDAKQRARRKFLEDELERSFRDLDNYSGPGKRGFVFGHGDLLCANVIKTTSGQEAVALIDYEYAVSCSAAFDIANHFAEWGGYDCDYNMLPTRSTRRMFLQEYLASYNQHADERVPDSTLSFLEAEVDRYRGIPGLYWGIWALIQATISTIDFNYAEYAEIRLDEYSAWRKAESGGGQSLEALPLRESRWAED
ncbi:hypothetical protein DV735_g5901, partial [Chaetothyriales sp. CBS 134920]